jgi:ADP-ribose pyrophosphatase
LVDRLVFFSLFIGDDAMAVQWMDLGSNLKLYASHIHFLEEVAKRLKASW